MFHRPLLALAAVLGLTLTVVAQTRDVEPALSLLGVPLDDNTQQADQALARHLQGAVSATVDYKQELTYEHLVKYLADHRNDAYVARVTPYAFVAARMLGARIEPVATYQSTNTKRGTTYRSYFVVRTDRFKTAEGREYDRTLDGVRDFVKDRSKSAPVKFVYHTELSTSSYFVPALWFRSHHIFDVAADATAHQVTRISTEKAGAKSRDLLQKVLAGEKDLAAVWDDTREEWQAEPNANELQFIPLPYPLPNDLLVVSKAVSAATRARLVRAIRDMKPGAIAIGDFDSWVPVESTPALEALAMLERFATAAPAPVVVRVSPAENTPDDYRDAVAQAVRLAGTEFALEVPNFHATADVLWTVQKVRDGSVVLSTAMAGDNLKDITQRFQLSFTSPEDLTKRVISLMHSRMHRVRYVWPYRRDQPTVIRSVDFSVPVRSTVRLERIVWVNPERNHFLRGDHFRAEVEASDTDKLVLEPERFRFADFHNPLSNVAYRAVLQRDSIEAIWSTVWTGSLIGLLLFAAVGAGIDLRRRVQPAPAPARRSLHDLCIARASALHRQWIGRTLRDADLLSCARPKVEETIDNYKQTGLVSDLGRVTKRTYGISGRLAIPGLQNILPGLHGSMESHLTTDPKDVSDWVRLQALLDLAIRKDLLSGFVGAPLEWDALNRLASEALELQLGAAGPVIDSEHSKIVGIVSDHFREVVEDGKARLCFFPGVWTVTSEHGRQFGRQHVELQGPIESGIDGGRVSALVLEFDLPPNLDVDARFDSWILGRIVRTSIVPDTRGRALCLHFRLLALVAGPVVTPSPSA